MRDYTDLSLPELDKLLRERSLATDGFKDSLVSRLEAYDAVNDPSPSPELHLSPVRHHEQKHQPRPASNHHLPTDPDEDYVDWDADDDVIPRVGIASELDMAIKTIQAADTAMAVGGSPWSNSSAITDDEYYPSQLNNASPTPIKKVSKSGYKYNSIAETFFPDDSSRAAISSSTAPAMTSPKSPSKPPKFPSDSPSRTPSNLSALSTRVLNTPTSSTPATPYATPSKPSSKPFSNILSKALALPAGNESAIATPVKPTYRGSATASTQTGSPLKAASIQAASATTAIVTPNPGPKVDVLPNSASTAAVGATENRNIAPKPIVGSGRLRTTQSGFQFNSISALFPGAVAQPPTPPRPQPIANVVVNTSSTYSTDVVLTPKEEEARRLIVRAARFGATSGSGDSTGAKGRKHWRSGVSDADYKAARERRLEIEKEKEREREIIRQRVTSSAKRQMNDEDDDKRTDNQYKRHRHNQYQNSGSGSRNHYHYRRRY